MGVFRPNTSRHATFTQSKQLKNSITTSSLKATAAVRAMSPPSDENLTDGQKVARKVFALTGGGQVGAIAIGFADQLAAASTKPASKPPAKAASPLVALARRLAEKAVS